MIILPLHVQFGYLLFLFLFLIAVTRTMLNRTNGSEYPCLGPEFSKKDFSFSPLSVTLAVGLS